MLTHTTRRREVGPAFSEGARQLWLVLAARGLRLRDINGAAQSRQAHYWLHGEKIPSPPARKRLSEAFGIEPALWDERPREPFTLPRAA